MRKDIVRDTPSLEEFCDYIERKGYDIDPFALYKEFENRDCTTAKGVRTKSWTALVDSRNSVVSKRRRNDQAVLLGIPKQRKRESKQKYRRRISNAKTKAVRMNYDEFFCRIIAGSHSDSLFLLFVGISVRFAVLRNDCRYTT